jgi:hypothetical protein
MTIFAVHIKFANGQIVNNSSFHQRMFFLANRWCLKDVLGQDPYASGPLPQPVSEQLDKSLAFSRRFGKTGHASDRSSSVK